MITRLSILLTLVIVSLIPAILLFLLFGKLNSADLIWAGDQRLQLGGPVAAFFITLTTLWQMYKGMRTIENPVEEKLKNLVGSWEIESRSSGHGRKARSVTTIALDDGELCIKGGTFFDVAVDGSKGDAIGDWTAEMAVSDGHKLKYFYYLTDSLATSPTRKGLVELVLQENIKIPTFHGTWQVIGKESHSGTIIMKKAN